MQHGAVPARTLTWIAPVLVSCGTMLSLTISAGKTPRVLAVMVTTPMSQWKQLEVMLNGYGPANLQGQILMKDLKISIVEAGFLNIQVTVTFGGCDLLSIIVAS